MASIVLNRADLWGVGVTVGLYPASSAAHGGRPRSAAVTTAVVAADGTVTFTGTANVPYVAHAYIGGESRNVTVQSSAFAPRSPWPWKTVVADRRTAIGTS